MLQPDQETPDAAPDGEKPLLSVDPSTADAEHGTGGGPSPMRDGDQRAEDGREQRRQPRGAMRRRGGWQQKMVRVLKELWGELDSDFEPDDWRGWMEFGRVLGLRCILVCLVVLTWGGIFLTIFEVHYSHTHHRNQGHKHADGLGSHAGSICASESTLWMKALAASPMSAETTLVVRYSLLGHLIAGNIEGAKSPQALEMLRQSIASVESYVRPYLESHGWSLQYVVYTGCGSQADVEAWSATQQVTEKLTILDLDFDACEAAMLHKVRKRTSLDDDAANGIALKRYVADLVSLPHTMHKLLLDHRVTFTSAADNLLQNVLENRESLQVLYIPDYTFDGELAANALSTAFNGTFFNCGGVLGDMVFITGTPPGTFSTDLTSGINRLRDIEATNFKSPVWQQICNSSAATLASRGEACPIDRVAASLYLSDWTNNNCHSLDKTLWQDTVSLAWDSGKQDQGIELSGTPGVCESWGL
mmetsp:Transcript_9239/g.20632  ORF Transcript_9239/g.20632 Transcript_9239/m.20632 type:complete len:475 (+) Transcript_9239:120-1544(+)